MHKSNNNMMDNKDNVIELSDDEESSEEELSKDSREHGSKGRQKKLQLLENITSVVWKFFRFMAGQDGKILELDKQNHTEVYCNKRYAHIKYTRDTSNIRYHLEKHHLTEYTQALSKQATEASNSGHSSAPLTKCSF